MTLETILSPAELPGLARNDLAGTACVVFDILRATSTFVTALQNGAAAVIPVSEIAGAVARRRRQPEVLLAGERDGVKIRAEQSGGVDFDFGNSPREFTSAAVRGQTIVSTTTNGTRALRACAAAQCVLAASFLNLAATAAFLRREKFPRVVLVCAGTGEAVALEDVLAAGALAEWLTTHADTPGILSDATQMAQETFRRLSVDLAAAMGGSQNGRRLLANPELREDVAFCAQRDLYDFVAVMSPDGAIRRGAIRQ